MYKLLSESESIYHTEKHIFIPNDLANRDWIEYQEWLALGNTPEPADEE